MQQKLDTSQSNASPQDPGKAGGVGEQQLDLRSGGVRLRVVVRGPATGPVVIGVHGLSANLMGFTVVGEYLAKMGFRMVAMDLRGRGRSDVPPPGSYGMNTHATDVLAIADALHADRFHIIGWSMGALVAMVLARDVPKRLCSVTIIDHVGLPDQLSVQAVLTGLARLDAVVTAPELYVEAIRKRAPIQRWGRFWEDYYRYELGDAPRADGTWTPTTSGMAAREDIADGMGQKWESLWPYLTMPTLLVRSSVPLNGGFIVPEEATRAFKATVPTARVLEVAANHFEVMNDEATLTALGDFLKSTATKKE